MWVCDLGSTLNFLFLVFPTRLLSSSIWHWCRWANRSPVTLSLLAFVCRSVFLGLWEHAKLDFVWWAVPVVPSASYKLPFLNDQIFTSNQNANVKISLPWQYSCNHSRIIQGKAVGEGANQDTKSWAEQVSFLSNKVLFITAGSSFTSLQLWMSNRA